MREIPLGLAPAKVQNLFQPLVELPSLILSGYSGNASPSLPESGEIYRGGPSYSLRVKRNPQSVFEVTSFP